jgi:thiol-disulfide isomerase/thioredoxin
MPLSEGRTTSAPKVLLAVALTFFVLRIGATVFDNVRTKEKDPIDWKTETYLDQAVTAPNGRLLLLWFTADWCGPCKTLNEMVFHNRDVVRVINDKFIPIKIVDRKKEDGKNSDRVQLLESNFGLYVFPTLVVALPTKGMESVDTQLGGGTARSCIDFFKHAIGDAPFDEGIGELANGEAERGIATLQQWLPTSNPTGDRTIYGALYLSAAYVAQGHDDRARQVLNECSIRNKDGIWPRPLLKYMDQSVTEIVESGQEEQMLLPDAHYFAGIACLARKDEKSAIDQFKWVRSHGIRGKHAYALAGGQLKRLNMLPAAENKRDVEAETKNTDTEK